MSVNVDYKRGLENEQINTVMFSLTDEKSLILSIIDNYDLDYEDKVASQSLKMVIKDNNYGEEELFIELDINDGKDLVKIMQKMLRQIGNFKPENIEVIF